MAAFNRLCGVDVQEISADEARASQATAWHGMLLGCVRRTVVWPVADGIGIRCGGDSRYVAQTTSRQVCPAAQQQLHAARRGVAWPYHAWLTRAGFYVSDDGRVNPVDAAMALAKGARMHGTPALRGGMSCLFGQIRVARCIARADALRDRAATVHDLSPLRAHTCFFEYPAQRQ